MLLAIGGLIAGFLVNLIAAYIILGMQENIAVESLAGLRERIDIESFRRLRWSLSPFFFAGFVVFFAIINGIFSHRMIKRIRKPLDILSDGVMQIQENNFAHRISYHNDDEIRPVCDAFNHMAAQLETAAAQRARDEANPGIACGHFPRFAHSPYDNKRLS